MDFLPVYEDELRAGRASPDAPRSRSPPERRQLLGVQTAVVREAPLGRTIRTVGRVAVDERRAAPRPHQVRRLRRAALRRLHRQVRPARASRLLVHLQPRARRHAAGVPARAGARRSSSPGAASPSVAPGRRRPARGGAPAAAALGHPRRGHRGARADGRGRSAPSTCTSDVSGYVVQKNVVHGHARDAGRHASSTSPTSRTSGSWPTSTSPTCRRSALGMPAEVTRAVPARAGRGAGRSPTSRRPSRRRRARSRCASRSTTRRRR